MEEWDSYRELLEQSRRPRLSYVPLPTRRMRQRARSILEFRISTWNNRQYLKETILMRKYTRLACSGKIPHFAMRLTLSHLVPLIGSRLFTAMTLLRAL